MLAYCVDFPCNPPRIAAENRLVCGAKILAIRRTPLMKTASQQKRRFVLPLYHAKLLNCDYRIARFAPFGKRKTDFFAFCPQTAPFRSGFRCICTKDKKKTATSRWRSGPSSYNLSGASRQLPQRGQQRRLPPVAETGRMCQVCGVLMVAYVSSAR